MSLSFQIEQWHEAQSEIAELCVRHWEEIALNKDVIPLDPDWDAYARVNKAGALVCATARVENRALVGYQIYFVMPHMHYKTSLTAISDVLFLAPEYRGGLYGMKLMKCAEERLSEMGVQRVIQNVKLHNDFGVLLERMGYNAFERLYAKLLKKGA